MPGVVLRVSGESFDPDLFLSQSDLQSYDYWYIGERLDPTGKFTQRVHTSSGFACSVSDVCDGSENEMGKQLEDALRFMSQHAENLLQLATHPSVDNRNLSFGIALRIGYHDVVTQAMSLPVEFLELAAQFKIGVGITIYPMNGDES